MVKPMIKLQDSLGGGDSLWEAGSGANSAVLKNSSGTASGDYSVAEGIQTSATSDASHAEGNQTIASNICTHAEGYSTTASGWFSHSEGQNTSATSNSSHAEGISTQANRQASHAEGLETIANGDSSHAEGWGTITNNQAEHASGSFNVSHRSLNESGQTLFSVGNGTADDARHNAFEIRQNGDIYITSGSSDIKLQDYIGGSVETVTAITPSNSGSTAPIATKVVAENEQIVSAALNDLNTNKQDVLSAGTGIEISSGNVISVTGGTGGDSLWEAGTGLNSVILKGSSGTASGDYSVAEGYQTIASENYSHAEGYSTSATSDFSHSEGYETLASGANSHAEGYSNSATSDASHAEGTGTLASGDYSHTEGLETSATSDSSHAEGGYTIASGYQSHAEGSSTLASGDYGSHAEGNTTSATSEASHSEGGYTIASGDYSHAEGMGTTASGESSHAEGDSTSATSEASHAEGHETLASGDYSHAEGLETLASGSQSHAEGYGTQANGYQSHAEGDETIANGNDSHTEGYMTIANNIDEHASGRYNVSNSASTEFGDSGNTLFSVGNGTMINRHNAFEIRQNGDIYIVSGGTDILLQDHLGGGGGSITVDQVLDNTTSASTNAVSSKAVYDAVTDNELVWTNAYVTLSGTVSAHTANTEIHVTTADKEKLHTHSNKSALDSITGNVGTMAYENTSSYSSATQVSTALQGKSNSNHNQGANTITAMTNYNAATAGTSSISTNDNLNTAIGKLENRFDGICLLKISQTDYDNLQTKDPNTLYVITD